MNIFKITHQYSQDTEDDRWIKSSMSFIDLWNHIKILQNITWDIDTSHDFTEDDTVVIMTKFFGARAIDPDDKKIEDELCEEGYYTIDLYVCWESGYYDDNGKNSISRLETDKMFEKYTFYKHGLYSAMLSRFLEQHKFGEGCVGAYESLLLDNKVWDVISREGIYDKDKFLAEQKTRPEFIKKYDFELELLAKKGGN